MSFANTVIRRLLAGYILLISAEPLSDYAARILAANTYNFLRTRSDEHTGWWMRFAYPPTNQP